MSAPARAEADAPLARAAAGAFRLAGRGRVDHASRVHVTFDGRSVTGLSGDTLASALLAHGIHLMGRSFKYHRPRGLVSAGSEEPNALVMTRRGPGRAEPNTRASMQEIYEGLAAESQNRWPSLGFDAGAVNDHLSPLIAAGFYYKTFMWPRAFWRRIYEPAIRTAAGLGRAPTELDADHYGARYHHCDLLVVGGGPAGLAAALTAARAGASVMIADEHAEMGGALLSTPAAEIDGVPAWDFLAATLAELKRLGAVVLPRTTAIGYFHQNMVGLAERVTDHLATPPEGAPRERLWRVRARRVVLAQGAIERPLVFPGNDRPGVMLAGAAATMLHRFGVLVGRRVAVLAAHDSAWHTAFDLADAGAEVSLIDVRPTVGAALESAAVTRSIAVRLAHTITATHGRLRLCAVDVAPLSGGAGERLPADCLLMSGGWTPSLHLFSHTRGSLVWDAGRETFLPGTTPEACTVAGAAAGAWGLGPALTEGTAAGAAAADAIGLSATASEHFVDHDTPGTGVPTPKLPKGRGKAFVDYQNDVTDKDIRLAVREGMRSIEHVKRYTTNGMATDQGKLSNINALSIAADALATPAPAVGLTTFRPPFTPTTFGALAGHHAGATFEVTRKTPIDPWAETAGAVFEPVSLWRRARYFPQGGETMDEAVARECRATREAVGLFDASTLGKIEVVGPDSAQFLHLMYTNPFMKLAVGRCRYGVLLGEDGFIRDDGVIARIDDTRYHVTTTTGGAPRVLAMMEDYLQTEWPHLKVWLTSTTEAWATIALNGPKAAEVLAPLVEGIDLAAFPHMSAATCRVAGIAARLMRMSFTGERGYEVNVDPRRAAELWDTLLAAGAPHGITPYGTETMHVLRAEKGFIIVGQDTDGTVTPDDAGLGWAIGKQKTDFVGRRSLSRPDMVTPWRRQLVGLLTEDPDLLLEEGAQIVADPSQPVPMRMIGHVTSSYRSATLGRTIALALVEGGRGRQGDTLHASLAEGTAPVRVCSPLFYDPDGTRMTQ
ncbi:sarcosine oxidase subunit alpha family protein [Acuticoccus mangrovi]|uniref:Sarcosine oxidase subunit alpha family protein n=1 Tax=Acuticoccus mangrovi TaxID=2796142 RepID=A0A934IMR9_9HYPH|nr:sarcosine oxidase subunit alpha family protein [Acuticoccus mangrovi]MBJ3775475.1 sarcosine oxidase subunit alpha family protein [Acuticoccus mangrovi]